jgi:predicted metal-binding membrane protein
VSSTAVPEGAGLRPAWQAARGRLWLIGALFALAAIAWWSTADRMDGMDAGPGTDLGGLGWFLGVWIVMMAAMMFPSVAPTVALYARMTKAKQSLAPFVFASGYLVTWAVAGLIAYGLFTLGQQVFDVSWDGAGQWLAGATLLVAAAYELTPAKNVCLTKCRSPLGFLMSRWRDGLLGALDMGARHGAWCVGCCWALMAALFALGVMSLAWMAFVAALIALEKTLPFGRAVTWGTAAILAVLGVLLIAAPDAIPGLTDPGNAGSMMAPNSMMMEP